MRYFTEFDCFAGQLCHSGCNVHKILSPSSSPSSHATVWSCHSSVARVILASDRWKIDFKLCLLVHKALVGHAPQYIADLIRPVADLPSRASLRTALSGDLYVPRTRRRFGDWALPLRPHACGIVYLLTSNSTVRRQHLSNAVLKLFYLTGASLNICKWLCNALPVF